MPPWLGDDPYGLQPSHRAVWVSEGKGRALSFAVGSPGQYPSPRHKGEGIFATKVVWWQMQPKSFVEGNEDMNWNGYVCARSAVLCGCPLGRMRSSIVFWGEKAVNSAQRCHCCSENECI